MPRFKPILTQDQFEDLHECLDKTKKAVIRVDREALSNLLQDHSELLNILEPSFNPMEEESD